MMSTVIQWSGLNELGKWLMLPLGMVGVVGCSEPMEDELVDERTQPPAAAVDAPFIGNVEQLETRALDFHIDDWMHPAELTPIVDTLPSGERWYVHRGNPSMLCRDSGNLLSGPIRPHSSSCTMPTKPTVLAGRPEGQTQLAHHWFGCQENSDSCLAAPRTDIWNFTYDGIMGIAHTNSGVFVMRHNEHQNAILVDEPSGNTYHYQGTIARDVHVTVAAAGGANWQNAWQTFGSFVSLGWMPDAGATEIEEHGPIAWPHTGYIDRDPSDGIRNDTGDHSGGPYQPALLEARGHLYTFFISHADTDTVGFDDRPGSCISMRRAPVGSARDPLQWRTFDRLIDDPWSRPSVPADFTTTPMAPHYDQNGDDFRGSCLFEDPSASRSKVTHFAVARLVGGGYIGVEARVHDRPGNDNLSDAEGTMEVGLRVSHDLETWSDLHVLFTTPSAGPGLGTWDKSDYTYPEFLSADGSTSYEVDPRDFWIIGKRTADHSLRGMHLRMDANVLTRSNIIEPGNWLRRGEARHSNSGRYRLRIADEALVLEDLQRGVAIWRSSASSKPSPEFVMQHDGNLVGYDGGAFWSTTTHGNAQAYAVLQDDGNFVIYAQGGVALWATHTNGDSEPIDPADPVDPPPGGSEGCGELASGEALWPGECRASCNGGYNLCHHAEGNVVLWDANGALWSTGTHGLQSDVMVMDASGNLILWGGGAGIWSTATWNNPGARLAIGDDGSLRVLGTGGQVLWQR